MVKSQGNPQNKVKENIISNLLIQNENYKFILKIVFSFKKERLWIGGGFIRSLVWDYLNHHQINSELGDIDVFYFNKESVLKERDRQIEFFLYKIAPNVNWSVKNQARMHLHNNETQYNSLTDALTKFPDTASSITVRLTENDTLDYLAPFGYEDLFNLEVRATPHFQTDTDRMRKFQERIIKKEWIKKWPKLTIADDPSSKTIESEEP